MSVNIVPAWAIQQFNSNVALLAQQKQSRLSAAVTHGSYSGEGARPVNQIGVIEMLDVEGRFQPMPRVDAALDGRWITPADHDLPQLVDTFDKLRLQIEDPKSGLTMAAVAAAQRKKDDKIIGAFFATAQTGKSGGTSTSFLAANVVSVNTGGAASPLNVAKLEAARKILSAGDVDLTEEAIHVAISTTDEVALRTEIQIISGEYNGGAAAFDDMGNLKSWRGYNFHLCNRAGMTTTATDDAAGQSRQVPMWVPSGMHLGLWNDVTTDVDRRADLRGKPWQVYTTLTANATRIEEKKVVKIWCR